MAVQLPNNVLQLSDTAGTAAYQFVSTVSGYTTFASQMSAGDIAPYFARDASAWEVGLGTRQTGPERLERSLLASSTGSLIVWPGTGTREVGCGIPGAWAKKLFDSVSGGAGMLVRNGLGSFIVRTLTGGTWVSVTNGSGLFGNPTLDDSGLQTNFLRRNATASLVAALEMAAGFSLEVDHFSGSPSVAPWNGPAGENMFRWRRTGAQDYLAELRQSSAWRRMLTANASDLNDADRLQTYAASAFLRRGTASGAQTIVSAGTVGWNHDLGAKPSMVLARLTCLTGEFNYSAGDTVELGAGLGNMTEDTAGTGGSNHGHSIRTDATSVVVRFGSNGSVYRIPGANTGASVDLTNGNWTVEFFPYV